MTIAMADVRCPCCSSAATVPVGPIPSANKFAGVYLDKPLPGGSLLQCRQCDVSFRHPRLSDDDARALYKAGRREAWPRDMGTRFDWREAARYLRKSLHRGRVLDIGCHDGRFLLSLTGPYELFGVEINEASAKAAADGGVQLVAADVETLCSTDEKFDAVFAFDVIEHWRDPFEFLRLIGHVLRRGGLAFVSTGNTRSPSWRLMKSRYWYCTVPEHISFVNPGWAVASAAKLGFDVNRIVAFSQAEGPLRPVTYCYGLLLNTLYLAAPSLTFALRRFRRTVLNQDALPVVNTPPMWRGARDHMLLIMCKR